MKNASVKNRISTRALLLGTAYGAVMLSGFSSAAAETLTVWSGYPNMSPKV